MISLSSFIPFQKKHASLPELFSRDAVLEELGVLPEEIQGKKIPTLFSSIPSFYLLVNLLAC